MGARLKMSFDELLLRVLEKLDTKLSSVGRPSYAGETSGGYSRASDFIANPSANNQAQPLLQVKFPCAAVHTITFGLSGAKAGCQFRAYVDWTIEGNVIKRLVTIGNGTSISAVATGVGIKVLDVSLVGTVATKCTVSAGIAPGTRPNTQMPAMLTAFRTNGSGVPLSFQFQTTTAPGGNVTVPIPAFAGIANVLVTVVNPAGAVADGDALVTLQNGATVERQWDPNTVEGRWMPVTPGANELVLSSSLANANWGVTFGIDG
jgi:hypothetical protein